MKKVIGITNIEDVCAGHIFTGCAIRDNNIVYLLVRPDISEDDAAAIHDYELATRLILLHEHPDFEELRIGAVDVENFAFPRLGVSLKPNPQALLLANDNHGSVLPIGGGRDEWPFEYLQENGMLMCYRLRCIDGYTWAACSRRMIYKRSDIGKWEQVRAGMPASVGEFGEGENKDAGFRDVDGFSECDVYAVGGKGDVWRYDGMQWHQCQFPVEDYLYTVCCAADGFVYIGAGNGLWRGRKHDWHLVAEFAVPEAMNDMRWFADKLWLAYDYRLQMWDGEELHTEIIYKGKKLPLNGAIDVGDGMMLVACSREAWAFDGRDWVNIIPRF